MHDRRIVFVITRMIRGGAARVALVQAEGLRDRGLEVLFVSGADEGVEGSLVREVRDAGFHVELIPAMVRNIHPILDARALYAIYRYLRKVSPTLIHTHTSKAGVLGRIAGKLAGIPYIVHSNHGHIYHDAGQIPGVKDKPLRKKLYFYTERFVNAFTDRIYTLTTLDGDEQAHMGLGPRQLFETLHNGVPVEKFRHVRDGRARIRGELGLGDEHFVIGAAGRLSPEKGFDVLLAAFQMIRQRHPGAVVVLIGDGEQRRQLTRQAKRLGIHASVYFLGLRSDMDRLYAAMDLFVLPARYEGFGMVIAEAMAAGIPIVATHVGGIPEVIEHEVSGLLTPPDDRDALASAVCELIEREPMRCTLAREGRNRVELLFSAERMQERLFQKYQELWHAGNKNTL